ncbi:hypothetical protein ERJ75_001381500 [Trypanosoma vivax]|nr:hypothetical protein ERJ75_001381500 [Trypanosoma vivax]
MPVRRPRASICQNARSQVNEGTACTRNGVGSTSRSTFRPITEAELEVVLRELSSGTAPRDGEVHIEELKQLGKAPKLCAVTVQL